MEHLIELKDVYKIYHMGDEEVHALDGVSLTIDKGEFVAIVGQSGSGKSTAMNIIGCLDVPTSGTYHLGGVDVSTMDDDQQAEIRNKMLGFIFQQYNLIPKLNVLENVELPLLYAGVPADQRRRRAVEALERFSRSPFPTRIVGFPSYLWFGLKRMEELGISLRLRPGSKILLAGGWKQHWQQQVDKSVLYSLVRRVLGVGEEDIHELFGAVEHPIYYNTCPRHHFHVPIYSRVLIRDPATLEPLPMGQVGLVNLISPLIRATPVTSVVTDDLGYLTPGDACGCGLTSPYLTLLGRVGLGDIKTCAAGAADLLGKGEGF